ncbi:MAG: nucleotidyltransferase family protein [Cryomorphaceae bacterium]|nr:nucleotidyltransferase domain-containing protein [Flavobacteriales bacterium]
MNTNTHLSHTQIENIGALCKKHRVKHLHVFGSLLTARYNENSDIDFLVSFEDMDYGDYADAYFGLAEDLEELLGRNVDLVTEKSLRNPHFIKSIESNKKLLYAA